jgi:hypothetical protein
MTIADAIEAVGDPIGNARYTNRARANVIFFSAPLKKFRDLPRFQGRPDRRRNMSIGGLRGRNKS